MTAYPTIRQFIGGQWVDGTAATTEQLLDPATGETIQEFTHVGAEQLDAALDSVAETARGWARTSPLERSDVIRKAAAIFSSRSNETAQWISQEQGKPLAESKAEIAITAEVIDWLAEEGRRAYGRIVPGPAGARLMVIPEPVGPVAAFTPWNFPALTIARKLAPALAAGCTIVAKASEETPAGAIALLSAFAEAGLPAGVANLVFGVPAQVSEHLLNSGRIRKVSLTGSIAVGKVLSRLAVDNDIVTTMELGGNAPVIVEPDVDIDEVVFRCVGSKFRNAGQVCNAPSRFYVHEDVYEEFISAAARRVSAITAGPWTDPTSTMGPLANARRVPFVAGLVDDARLKGASAVVGGEAIEGKGNFYAPTVLRDVPDSARIFAEEVFGPVMPIAPYSDLDDAISRANSTDYGLGSFAFTSSLEKAHRIAADLNAGMVGINTTVISRAETPFGGRLASGHGWESGVEGVEAYLQRKSVLEHDPVTPGSGITH